MSAAAVPLEASFQEIDDACKWFRYHKVESFFPDTGPLRRDLYQPHLRFFAKGKEHRERGFIAGNRTGKTEAGAYETTLHLTGEYPDWWIGARWKRPIKGWAAGDTNKTVREVLQEKLLGPPGDVGSGMIPKESIVHRTAKQGVSEAVDTIYVKHASGGVSQLRLKSYQEGRESFQAASLDWIWLDEECPEAIYDECVMRTMTTNGRVILTFTPLLGLTPVCLRFLPGGEIPSAT
jgi:phage terminase large subunit-like protein